MQCVGIVVELPPPPFQQQSCKVNNPLCFNLAQTIFTRSACLYVYSVVRAILELSAKSKKNDISYC